MKYYLPLLGNFLSSSDTRFSLQSLSTTTSACWTVMSFPTKRPHKAFEWRKPWLAESRRLPLDLSDDAERVMYSLVPQGCCKGH